MKLYYHKTDGGAEYLFDTYVKCENGHKEGTINDKTKYIVRIDGDIEKDAELNVRDEKDYTIHVKRIQEGSILVEADNKEEAIEKAEEKLSEIEYDEPTHEFECEEN